MNLISNQCWPLMAPMIRDSNDSSNDKRQYSDYGWLLWYQWPHINNLITPEVHPTLLTYHNKCDTLIHTCTTYIFNKTNEHILHGIMKAAPMPFESTFSLCFLNYNDVQSTFKTCRSYVNLCTYKVQKSTYNASQAHNFHSICIWRSGWFPKPYSNFRDQKTHMRILTLVEDENHRPLIQPWLCDQHCFHPGQGNVPVQNQKK